MILPLASHLPITLFMTFLLTIQQLRLRSVRFAKFENRFIKAVTYLLIIIPAFADAQTPQTDSSKFVNWQSSGLRAENYRLVDKSPSMGDYQVAAVTASKPGLIVHYYSANGQSSLEISMTNQFNYDASWMVKSEVDNSALLKHEQGHFDINEIYTRKAFEQLKNFHFTADFQKEIQKIMDILNKQLTKQQQIYESQTQRGLNEAYQLLWNKSIASQLAQLPPYEDKQIVQQISE